MKNQLRGIGLLIFAVLIVVIGSAMSYDYPNIVETLVPIGSIVGIVGLALVFIGNRD